MTNEEERIIESLERLNTSIAKQNSIGHIFMIGIIYGVGFVVGSAIIATIALGIVGPIFGQIPWVHSTFQAGVSIIR